jgi:iron-sulfur cluster assembly accessory protein
LTFHIFFDKIQINPHRNKEGTRMALLDIQTDEITLTPSAIKAVEDLINQRNLEGYALRVYVAGGGCSGYQYGMALDDNPRENDREFNYEGVRLLVDEISIGYLSGARIDYVDELMGSGFKIENPNAVASCGCGHSFRTSEEGGSDTQASDGGCC